VARTIAKNHENKRVAILTASSKIFADVGFDRASMAQVAKECGSSKAALYHYFPSKNAILFAVLDQHLSQLTSHVLGLERLDLSAEDYLAYMVEEILIQYQGNDAVHELQIHALGQLDVKDQKILVGEMRKLVSYVSAVIKEARPAVFSADDESLRMATMSLFGMLNWYYTWNGGRGLKGRRNYARFAVKVFLNGI
jgi:AcrR family transcriptional regulator|tara:strand:- start:1120 stop:1707 length:588 start_codon:yes stop_codon:yes gene_type:complete